MGPSRAVWVVLTAASVLGVGIAVAAPDQELVPATEAADAQKVVATIEGAIDGAFAHGARPSMRDAHAKGHGCVRADFTILPGLPADLRHGVFAAPRTYKAWIRFSNSAGTPQKDFEADARGMAIKLMDVAGAKLLPEERDATTQDFVMINYPVFFIRNVADYLSFVTLVLEDKIQDFFATHPREGALFAAFNATPVDKVFNQRFFSGSPYRLGERTIKFSAIPTDCTSGTKVKPVAAAPKTDRPNYLREGMVAWLAAKEACFTFAVQPQVDREKQPIEDTTVLWNETDAPFVDVASIHIKPQTFDTAAQQTFCENLSFTPWHALPEHRPVGGINRLRRSIYAAISTLRHRLNAAPRAEPTGHELFP